jgi:cytochrome c oxidase assembly protein Cox11
MPVLFSIDPEYVNDPELAHVNEITLSYTFFESKNFNYEEWLKKQPEAKAALN